MCVGVMWGCYDDLTKLDRKIKTNLEKQKFDLI